MRLKGLLSVVMILSVFSFITSCSDGGAVAEQPDPNIDDLCKVDADCSGGSVCMDGVCSLVDYVECTSDSDCAEGLVCKSNSCVADEPEVEPVCGDGTCETGETTVACPEDCKELVKIPSARVPAMMNLPARAVVKEPATSDFTDLYQNSIIKFADHKLKQSVIDKLKEMDSSSNKEEVTVGDCRKITYLEARNLGIERLDGLQWCTNLSGLYLNGNDISDISPLKALKNLQSLDLAQSIKLNDISALADLKELSYLYLSSTGIGEDDTSVFLGLPKLKDLYLSYTEIKDVRFLHQLTGLNRLSLPSADLDNDGISFLKDFRKLTTLLILDGNPKIDDISVIANLTALEVLKLSGININNDDMKIIAKLPLLCRLEVVDAQISDISPLTGLTNVMTLLNLSGNQISDISPLAELTNLTWLGLGSNQISDISPLKGLTKLNQLYISKNQIHDIEPLVLNAEAGVLEHVMLWDNPLDAQFTDSMLELLRVAYGVEVVL